MILIADSGSTKCDWKLVSSRNTFDEFSTKGFNPFFWEASEIANELHPVFQERCSDKNISKIVFYGAGCSDEKMSSVIKKGLSLVLPQTEISIHHDLLAAARATCGTKPGMSSIIGTGSNTCLYDGKKIIDNISNLGFLLGDEGSGSHLGKELIRSYSYREMPEDLKLKFEAKYELKKPRTLVHRIYNSESTNVYLASFSKFYSENANHPFIQKLAKKCFLEFVERHLVKYANHKELPAHFVGSIAYYFQDILKFVLEEKGITLGKVIKKPINNLVVYHQATEQFF